MNIPNKTPGAVRFDNHIHVIDASGRHLNPSYIHRAKGLVKNGRAEWVDDKTIRMIAPLLKDCKDSKATFVEYLTEKGVKPPTVEKYLMLSSKLQAAPDTTQFINDIIYNGINGDGVGQGTGAAKTAYQFMDDYAAFCGKSSAAAAAYRRHLRQAFEEPARKAVNGYKEAMVFIPENTIIDPYFLDGLSNDEFVAALKALQWLVYGIYEEIERTSPFEWGWQGWQDMAAYGIWHNRIMGLLGAFTESGNLDGNALVVSKKKLWQHDIVKKQNQINNRAKTNMIIAGLMDMGFSIEGFDDKKCDTFTVSCPDTPNLIAVLAAYFKERRRECCKCHKSNMYPCRENCDVTIIGHHKQIFSYRFVEKHPSHTHDTEVLMMAVTDSAPAELRHILMYLHDEADRHGYKIPPWTPAHGGAIQHWRYSENWGAKMWLTVGSGTSWMDFFYTQSFGKWTLKTTFERVFKKYPEQAKALAEMFPQGFDPSSGVFTLENPNLDEVKAVLEWYKLENNIGAGLS